MPKIQMKTPLVEMDGDEMTRVIWKEIKEQLILPFVDLKTEYYDLGLENRDRTADQVTIDSANATKRYGVAVKCATITPNAQRMTEYNLHQMWKSPNGTIRAMLDGTVFRAPILVEGIRPTVRTWEKPITIARHAYGDVYRNVEMKIPGAGKAELVYTAEDGTQQRATIFDFKGPGIVQGVHNVDKSIASFAHACFRFALDQKQDLWFSTKDTISKTYDHHFKDIFQEIYDTQYKEAFEKACITYFYTLIDDAVARVVRSKGGFIWACKNYDGDVMSDMIATAFGSLAMMTSVLVSPDGQFEYEAAHGTVTRHYYRYLKGEETSTNPVATIFAWSGALRKRGELDNLPDLVEYADLLEQATLGVIQNGVMTKDLAALYEGPCRAVNTQAFLQAIHDALAAAYEEDDEEDQDIVTMTAPDGSEEDFEIAYRAQIGEDEYAVLVPLDEDDQDVLVLQVIYDEDADEEAFAFPEDEEAAEEVFELFKDDCADMYNFVDDEEEP